MAVNWGDAPEHLGLRTDKPGIWVNLPDLQTDFEAMLNKYRDLLIESSKPGRKLRDQWWTDSVQPATTESELGWQTFLDQED